MESLFKECFAARFKRVMPLEVKNSSSHSYKHHSKSIMKAVKLETTEEKHYHK